MGYKFLGFTVWHGANWFARRKYRQVRRPLAFGVVAVAIAALAVAGARRDSA